MQATGNILSDAVPDPAREVLTTLLAATGVRIERIVSFGQASPPGFWYDQTYGEWVLLLAGAAALEIEGEGERRLGPGDFVWLPPRRRHRVNWTERGQATVWLAVHVAEAIDEPR
jgi:cupin 2 domain-containing protein